MTWNSVAVALTPPQVGWWNTAPAPSAAPQSGTWGSSPLYILATGIATAEAFGTLMVTLAIAPTGIPSAEAFGNTVVKHVLAANQPQLRVAVQRASTI